MKKKKTTKLEMAKPILPPVGLRLFEERLPAKKIARRVDKRPLRELEAQVEDSLKQILVRVHSGDDDALLSFFLFGALVARFIRPNISQLGPEVKLVNFASGG